MMTFGQHATAHLRSRSALWALAAMVVCAVLAGRATAVERAGLGALRDLRAEAALAVAHGKPLIVLFSLPGCQYCAVVRTNYLLPLTRTPRAAERFVVRELTLTEDAPLAGFHGEQTSARKLAAHYGVRVAPAVVLLDAEGALLAPPLVGGDMAGMYGAYLDRALADARASLAGPAIPKPHLPDERRREKQP